MIDMVTVAWLEGEGRLSYRGKDEEQLEGGQVDGVHRAQVPQDV